MVTLFSFLHWHKKRGFALWELCYTSANRDGRMRLWGELQSGRWADLNGAVHLKCVWLKAVQTRWTAAMVTQASAEGGTSCSSSTRVTAWQIVLDFRHLLFIYILCLYLFSCIILVFVLFSIGLPVSFFFGNLYCITLILTLLQIPFVLCISILSFYLKYNFFISSFYLLYFY